MFNKSTYLSLLFLMVSLLTFGQDRFEQLNIRLQEAAKTQTGLNNTVNISVNHYTLQEVIRAIAQDNNLNVSVDPSLNATPSYNFTNAIVKDVFLLLCKEHNLTLEWTGEIISFKKFIPLAEPPKVIQKKEINITYSPSDSIVTGTLQKDTLFNVVQKLSKLAKINIDVAPSLRNESVSMTIVDQSFTDVLSRLAGENEWHKISDNFYQIKKSEVPIDKSQINSTSRSSFNSGSNNRNKSSRNSNSQGEFEVYLTKDSLISVQAIEGNLSEIISEVCKQSGNNFFLFDEAKGSITLNTHELGFEETLSYLLNTSDYTYKRIDSVYIIGDRKKEKFRHTETFQFQYRTIEGIPDFIPADLKKDIEIMESVELNSLILSGSLPQINELKKFFYSIDKVVPMILIEVMLVDINKSRTISTGISVSDQTGPNSSNLNGTNGLSLGLNALSLNRILSAVNSLGYFNLGDIGNDFYLSMNALESNGDVKIVSTPKLAALNGHEAQMSIGETAYYKEISNNIVGLQISQTVQSFVYKPLNADLSLTIKAVVSGDDQITLEISVSQSTFTTRIEPGAPPGNQKREFKSIIRMKNQEMVVLGGLDNKKKEDTTSGVPVLSRIPVIKWFFGNRSKVNDRSELTIFIRPTVIQ